MDGDAFQPIARLELARIIEDLARRARYIGAQDGMKLKAVDANGRGCGYLSIYKTGTERGAQ